MAKIKIDLKLERYEEPPDQRCSLCEEMKPHYQLMPGTRDRLGYQICWECQPKRQMRDGFGGWPRNGMTIEQTALSSVASDLIYLLEHEASGKEYKTYRRAA